jgi:hypothetical protein
MKKLFAALTMLMAFSAFSQELELQECKFKNLKLDFMPSTTLGQVLKNDLGTSRVYRVTYRKGKTVSANDIAAVHEGPGKSLSVLIYKAQEDRIDLTDQISIDLKSPISTDAPVISFEADLNRSIEGKCLLNF